MVANPAPRRQAQVVHIRDTRDWIERSKDREYAHLLELQCTGKLPLVDLKDEEPWR
jgi:hypothetical protein